MEEYVISLINQLGFPAFVCIVLFWFMHDVLKEIQETLKEIQNVLTKLVIRLEER